MHSATISGSGLFPAFQAKPISRQHGSAADYLALIASIIKVLLFIRSPEGKKQNHNPRARAKRGCKFSSHGSGFEQAKPIRFEHTCRGGKRSTPSGIHTCRIESPSREEAVPSPPDPSPVSADLVSKLSCGLDLGKYCLCHRCLYVWGIE